MVIQIKLRIENAPRMCGIELQTIINPSGGIWQCMPASPPCVGRNGRGNFEFRQALLIQQIRLQETVGSSVRTAATLNGVNQPYQVGSSGTGRLGAMYQYRPLAWEITRVSP
jgi:hypothetical protein